MQKDIAKYQFAVKCGHIEADDGRELYEKYNHILRSLVNMISKPEYWLL